MSETLPRHRSDRSFLLLLTPLMAASLPSLIFCALAVVLWLHGFPAKASDIFNFQPANPWDRLFAFELSIYEWLVRWNSAVTLAATALFVSTILLRRWRHWIALALVPYGLLLCADFTLRWR
jgi:hypothetical protein